MNRYVRTASRRAGNNVAAARLRAAAAVQGIDLHLTIAPRAKVSPQITPAFWGVGGTVAIRIAAGAVIERGVILRLTDGAKVDIGPEVTLRTGVVLNVSGHLEFEGRSVITWYSTIHCAERVTFREYSGMSEHATVVDSTHFRSENPEEFGYNNFVSSPITIGRHAWLAGKSTILYGANVGNFGVVSANSVVVRPVPEWALVGGNPAVVMQERYTGAGARARKARQMAKAAEQAGS